MPGYQHNVTGFFNRRSSAEATLEQLLRAGLRPEQLQIITAASLRTHHGRQQREELALQSMLNDGLLGAALGSGIGILVQIGLLLSGTQLFALGPLLSPPLLIGWGAFIGGFLGGLIGVVGAAVCAGTATAPWREPMALYSGDVILLAQTCNAQETSLTRTAIWAAAGLCRDLNVRGQITR